MSEQDIRKTLEKLALITASPIRTAIVSVLEINRMESYSELKKTLEESIKAEISDGTLSWHLQKLMVNGIIEKVEGERSAFMVGEKGGRRIILGETVFKSFEGYRLTIEGNNIKQAVIAAVNKITKSSE